MLLPVARGSPSYRVPRKEKGLLYSVEQLINESRADVCTAAGYFFTWKNIGNIAAADRDVPRALQANALTWDTVTHALLVTFLTRLGCLFDVDKRSFNVRTLIDQCRIQRGEFGKSALEERKIRGNLGRRPDWLDQYLAEADEPRDADFEALSSAVDEPEKVYQARYEPLRHKVVAHIDPETIWSRDALLVKTNIAEIQKLLGLLYGVVSVIDRWFLNGERSSPGDHRLNEEKYMIYDLNSLFARISGSR